MEPHKAVLSPRRSLIARWMDLSNSCRRNTLQKGVSSPLEAHIPLSISFVTRMILSSPVNRKTCWKRSEEHTSELQSRLHLVCRLLLEKKKNKIITHHHQEHTTCLLERPQ